MIWLRIKSNSVLMRPRLLYGRVASPTSSWTCLPRLWLKINDKLSESARGTSYPFLFEKSVYTVVTTLAVLKAGGAYLALDLAHPIERLRGILEDTQATGHMLKELRGFDALVKRLNVALARRCKVAY
jgi:hypothetical protein